MERISTLSSTNAGGKYLDQEVNIFTLNINFSSLQSGVISFANLNINKLESLSGSFNDGELHFTKIRVKSVFISGLFNNASIFFREITFIETFSSLAITNSDLGNMTIFYVDFSTIKTISLRTINL